ncbi:MAG: hypothetical protein Kow00109_26060 [Acidobacteriota bacterium]
MARGLAAFLLGFGCGALTLAVFRHEVSVTQDLPLLVGFALVGAAGGLFEYAWYRRIRRRLEGILEPRLAALQREWVAFLWGTLVLGMLYFGLMILFLGF